ncbi:hypothetical protein HK104_010536 [Borealophlyctis nickersoniae]|nr:hypothetical protein HK104_010536 [Borealophlyctis nickersoniae]
MTNWQPGCQYSAGSTVHYNGATYKVVQSHTSQGDWDPTRTPALFARCDEGCAPQTQAGGYGYCPPACPPAQQHQPQYQQQAPQGGGYGYQQTPQQPPQYQQQPPQYGSTMTGGYPATNQSQAQAKQEAEKHAANRFGLSDDQMKIGGGLLGTAAAIGLGAWAFNEYKEHKEEAAEDQWGEANWYKEAVERQKKYLQAVQCKAQLPPVTWILTDGNHIPAGAIRGGQEADGTPLYIIRAFHKGGVHVGKISPKMKKAHFSWGGKEIEDDKYEILLGYENAVKWVDCAGKLNLQGNRPVEAGREADGRPLYIAQAHHKGGVHPGKCGESMDGCMICYGMDEHMEKRYRFLAYA